ncbi:unnamed protein product [Rhizophagus irregularis]|nr:unnamed protein product [Rhizophagus irregularis]
MNNKKSKIETFNSVSDLVKHKKSKIETSTSVSDLVKPRKSKIETSASVSDLIKSKKTKIEISTSVSNLIKSKTANSIKSKKPKMADLIKPRKRYLYPCHCIRCDGAEVDFRTQENHTNDETPDENKDNDEYIYYNEEEENDDDEDDGDEDDGDEDDGDENERRLYEEEDDDDDGDDDDEEEDIEEFFSSPEIGNDEVFVMESLNDSIETEIILWVFKFQQRFRLPDIALEVLNKILTYCTYSFR